jgi:hypothetical protein
MGRPLCGQEVMKATGGRSSPIDGHGRQGRKLGVMELRELAFYRRLGREVGEDLAFQMTAALAGVAVARTAASWGGGGPARGSLRPWYVAKNVREVRARGIGVAKGAPAHPHGGLKASASRPWGP